MTHEKGPWAPPADWGEWISILLAARALGVSRETIDRAPIRQARMGHRTVVVCVADVVDWVNMSIRNRYIASDEVAS
jgi:hypothetical protein